MGWLRNLDVIGKRRKNLLAVFNQSGCLASGELFFSDPREVMVSGALWGSDLALWGSGLTGWLGWSLGSLGFLSGLGWRR